MQGRVLDVTASERKLTLTLKRGLISSQLPPLVHIQARASALGVLG